MLTSVRSGGIPRRCAAASMMRRLAWCGTNHATSSTVDARRGPASIVAESTTARTARRNTSLALHLQVVPALGDRLGRGRGGGSRPPGSRGAPAADPSQPRSHARSDGASPDAAGDDRRAGTVAEQHERRSVLGIDDAAQRLGADDEHVLVADADHRRADDELVHEARARGREVERSAPQAERFTDERAGVGERLLG